jgi:hypothetical protein
MAPGNLHARTTTPAWRIERALNEGLALSRIVGILHLSNRPLVPLRTRAHSPGDELREPFGMPENQ